jgi:hypothetical protein
MNDQQARFVRKLKVEHNCSYPTIARQFYNEYGDTTLCSKDNAERVMYFDMEDIDSGVKIHNLREGSIPDSSIRVVEYIFSTATGESLCSHARSFFDETIGDGWSDFSNEYESSAKSTS